MGATDPLLDGRTAHTLGYELFFLSPRRVPHETAVAKMSSVQNSGWLFYIRGYSTRLYRAHNKPLFTNHYKDHRRF